MEVCLNVYVGIEHMIFTKIFLELKANEWQMLAQDNEDVRN